MQSLARILIGAAGALIAAGGFYDTFTPKLPKNLAAICEAQPKASQLARELLRALGGALIAIGLSILCIAFAATSGLSRSQLALVVLLALPAEGINFFAMRRVASPWQIPALFLTIALAGVLIAAMSS